MPKNRFHISDKAKKANNEIKLKNKQLREQQASVIKAAKLAEFEKRERSLKNYRGLQEQRDYELGQEREQLQAKLDRIIEDTLLNPDSRSYAEWRSGMMNIAAAAGALNALLFSYNLRFTGLVFYISQRQDASESLSLSHDKRMRSLKEFLGFTGTLPPNFDPEFSIHGEMKNGRAFAKLYTGEHAEEVLFTKSAIEPSMVDIFLAAYLLEKTDYQMVLDPNSSMYRQVHYTKCNVDDAKDLLKNHPEAVGSIQLSVDPEKQPYKLRATNFEQDPETNQYFIVAEGLFVNTEGKVEKEVFKIPVSAEDKKDNASGYFEVPADDDHPGVPFPIKYGLPGKMLTSQEELDDVLGGDKFRKYCQNKINQTVTGLQANVKLKVKENDEFNIEAYQIVNGTEDKINVQLIADDLQNELISLVKETTGVKMNDDNTKIQLKNKFQMPEEGHIANKINDHLVGSDVYDYQNMQIDIKNKKVYLTTHDGEKFTVNIHLNQTDDDHHHLIISFSGEISDLKPLNIVKENKALTEKELNDEFGPRLRVKFEEKMKSVLNEMKDAPLKLIKYNSPAPSSGLSP